MQEAGERMSGLNASKTYMFTSSVLGQEYIHGWAELVEFSFTVVVLNCDIMG